jgi:hypothetical protein
MEDGIGEIAKVEVERRDGMDGWGFGRGKNDGKRVVKVRHGF